MKNYIVRDGQVIIRHGTCQDSDLSLQATGTEIADENTGNWNDHDHYHDGSNYVDKLTFSLTVSATSITTAETLTITGIPTGTTVIFPGGEEIVNDGEIEWDSTVAGDFVLEFKLFPYFDLEVPIEVTDV